MEWRKNKIKEINIILNNSNNIKEVEVIARPKNNNDQTKEHTADENTQQIEKAPVGMWNLLWTGPDLGARWYHQCPKDQIQSFPVS